MGGRMLASYGAPSVGRVRTFSPQGQPSALAVIPFRGSTPWARRPLVCCYEEVPPAFAGLRVVSGEITAEGCVGRAGALFVCFQAEATTLELSPEAGRGLDVAAVEGAVGNGRVLCPGWSSRVMAAGATA
jgi:hypothetical protein